MLCHSNSIDSLLEATYPQIRQCYQEDRYFLNRTVFSCKNDDIDEINANMLEKFPGDKMTLQSADSIQQEDGGSNNNQPYPAEYLNSITASGLPLAKLELKKGCPIMLLRNLDPSKGLCNGTRLIIMEIY